MVLHITQSKSNLLFGISCLIIAVYSAYETVIVVPTIVSYELYFHSAQPCNVDRLGDPRCIINDTLTVTNKYIIHSGRYITFPSYRVDLTGSTGAQYRGIDLPQEGNYTSTFYDSVKVGDHLDGTLWLHDVLTLRTQTRTVAIPSTVNNASSPIVESLLGLFGAIFFGFLASLMLIKRDHPRHRKPASNSFTKTLRFLADLYVAR